MRSKNINNINRLMKSRRAHAPEELGEKLGIP